MSTKDYFISYTAADVQWAEWIAWTLEQEGYACILQAWDFVPGRDFMQMMRTALDDSRQVLAVVSAAYLRSAYAGAELNAALVRDPLGDKGMLIPVRIEQCELGGILAGRVYIDLVNKSSAVARRDLLHGVAAARLGRRVDAKEAGFQKPPPFPLMDVPARPVQSGPNQAPGTSTSILYLGSDTGAGLDLRGQIRQIRKAVKAGRFGHTFTIHSTLEVTTENIFALLNDHQPNIVHFSGKQNGGNVLIRTPEGNVTTVSDSAMAGMLQSLGGNVLLAIMDTCKSLRCARSVTSTVDFAIGVEGDIFDDDATHYYNVFYGALAAGQTLSAAAGQATAALRFRKVPKTEIPTLCARKGTDPRRLAFAQARRTNASTPNGV